MQSTLDGIRIFEIGLDIMKCVSPIGGGQAEAGSRAVGDSLGVDLRFA